MDGPSRRVGTRRSTARNTATDRRLAGRLAVMLLTILPALPLATARAFARPVNADGPTAAEATAAAALHEDLVVNGNAEDGPFSETGREVVASIPGWTRTDSVNVVGYASGQARWPTASDPGPVVRGVAFFTGGPQDQVDSLHQAIDLSALAATIDSGAVRFDLAAYLGGVKNSDDIVSVQARFLDPFDTLLEAAAIGPVTAADRDSLTGLLLRTASGVLPPGARTALVTITFVGVMGEPSQGLADSVGLSLSRTLVAGVAWPEGTTGLRLVIAPDPAVGDTYVAFTLPATGRARVEVLDVAGRRVALLAEGVRPAGRYELRWSPRQSGAKTGVYFVRLATSSGTLVRRLVALAR